MRIDVDFLKCESNGLCVTQAPLYFALTDDDELNVLSSTPTPEDLASVEQAVRMCPKQALSLVDD
jgi:ferredoxin